MMRTGISRQKALGVGRRNGHRSPCITARREYGAVAGLGWFPPYGASFGSEALGPTRARHQGGLHQRRVFLLTGYKSASLGRVNFAPEGMTF